MVKLFDEIPEIKGDYVTLSPVTQEDAECLREMVEDDFVYSFDPTYLFERQYKDVHEAIANMYGEIFQNKESLILAIRRTSEQDLLGLAEFYDYREDIHGVFIGYRLARKNWGQGIATAAVRLMVDYLYDQIGIDVVCAQTMTENAASERVLEKVGFIRTSRDVAQDWGYEWPISANMWFY